MLGFGFNKTKVLASAERYVQQGKLQNAIAEYEKVIKEDPKDLTVLNTIGDLYARVGQVETAVTYFRTVGDSYASEGFAVKAIAMYKKLTKASPGNLECVQKLAELYTQQGLYNDARQQYMVLADAAMRGGRNDEAARIFSKVLEFDPENTALQAKLADLYLRTDKKEAAKNIFLRSAETLHQRGQFDGAKQAIGRVLSFEPANGRALQMRAQIALDSGDTEEATALFEKIPDLDSRPEALRALLAAYMKTARLEDAAPIAKKLLAVHNDIAGVETYAAALVTAGQFTDALRVYEEHADQMLAANGPALLQTLNNLISRVKDDTQSLDVLRKLFLKAGDSTHSSEIFELLAHSCVQSGDFQRASDLYKELSELEPENPLHEQNYRQIVTRMGQDVTSRPLSEELGAQALMIEELELPEAVLDQHYPDAIAVAIQTALTESELFDSYNVPSKAIPPLETVLSIAPQDVRVNQRLASLYARTVRNSDAALRCAVLEKIFSSAGHPDEALRYGEMASKYAELAGVSTPIVFDFTSAELSPGGPEPAPSFSISPELAAAATVEDFSFDSLPSTSQSDDSQEQSGHIGNFFNDHASSTTVDFFADSPALPKEPAPEVVAHPVSAPVASSRATAREMDLSDEWEIMAQSAPPAANDARPTTATPQLSAEITDSIDEVQFYVAQSMWTEAGAALDKLTALAPNAPEIAQFRAAIDANSRTPQQASQSPFAQPIVTEEPIGPDTPLPDLVFEAESAQQKLPEPLLALDSATADPLFELPLAKTSLPVSAAAAAVGSDDVLGGFVSDLEDSLGGDFAPAQPVAAKPLSPIAAPISESDPLALEDDGMFGLGDLFDEFKEEVESGTEQSEDPDTHYNLGVAFKEMGLLDEAIGELQKVCQAIDRGHDFAQSMQAYTWLAGCFVEKGIPEASFKWYQRALSLAENDEIRSAIHYELACAYETASMKPEALRHFMEVYTTNIDFRDVAERIKALRS